MTGLFITLEGIDGCGKSTQIDMLARALKGRGLGCIITREPGGTALGEQVRALLVSDASVGVSAKTELFLIAAARAQHVAELISPAIEAGRIVISDRYIDSTVAFQGYGRGLDLAMMREVNRFATGGLMPDLTILLDLEPNLARARLSARPVGGLLGALDDEKPDFHERVRDGYLKLAAAEPSRIRTIDASQSAGEIHREALGLVLPLLNR